MNVNSFKHLLKCFFIHVFTVVLSERFSCRWAIGKNVHYINQL